MSLVATASASESAPTKAASRAPPRAISGGSPAGAAKPGSGEVGVTAQPFRQRSWKGKTNPSDRGPVAGSLIGYFLPMTASTCSSGSEDVRNAPE
jgi:hypothetical protein